MSRSGSSAQFGGYLPQESLGPSFDRYHAQMQHQGLLRSGEQTRGAGEGKEIAISMAPTTIPKITGTGEIRNGFAPGAQLLNSGPAYENNRVQAEHHVLGIPYDADHTGRPIYGYLTSAHDREPGYYGHAVLDVQPHPRREVTTSPSDSLDEFIDNLGHHDDPEYAGQSVEVEGLDHDHTPLPSHHNYREVQIHGGPIDLRREVSRGHLFRTDFNSDQIDRASSELKMARVPHRVYQNYEYQPTLDRDTFGEGKTGWVDEQAYQRSR